MVKLKNQAKFAVVIVGAGGTGSLVACDFARFIATGTGNERVSMALIDGDIVEKKNCSRQMFSAEDIGLNKAEALGIALSEVYGITPVVRASYIESSDDVRTVVRAALSQLPSYYGESRIPVVISCVDNIPARKAIEDFFEEEKDCYYIDSGNDFSSGQCIYAYKEDGRVISPTVSFYGFVYDGAETRSRQEISCAELNNVAPQHLLTNREAAQNILAALYTLLQKNEVMDGFVMFDAFNRTCSWSHPEDFGWKPEKGAKKKQEK